MLTTEDAHQMAAASNHASSNAPPAIDLAATLDPKALQEWLDYQYADHATQMNVLLAMHARFLAAFPGGITSEDVSMRAVDAVKSVNDELARLEATRETIKNPVLHAQRLIDGDAKKIKDALTPIKASFLASQTVWLSAKEDRIRKEAAEEAARKDLEAQRLIAAAEQSNAPEAIDAAVVVLGEAQQAATLATASTLDLTRARSSSGALTGLKDNWQFRVTDQTLVPGVYLMVNETMVKAAMKTAGKNIEALKIPGIEFYNDKKARG